MGRVCSHRVVVLSVALVAAVSGLAACDWLAGPDPGSGTTGAGADGAVTVPFDAGAAVDAVGADTGLTDGEVLGDAETEGGETVPDSGDAGDARG